MKWSIEMVCAKLFIICENCGSNDNFEYNHSEHRSDDEETKYQWETTIKCKNCSTIHWLNDYCQNMNKERGRV